MNELFVWMITQTEPIGPQDVSIFHWRCERFSDEGKTGEVTGVATLLQPISQDALKNMSPEQRLEALFAVVSKDSTEASLKA